MQSVFFTGALLLVIAKQLKHVVLFLAFRVPLIAFGLVTHRYFCIVINFRDNAPKDLASSTIRLIFFHRPQPRDKRPGINRTILTEEG